MWYAVWRERATSLVYIFGLFIEWVYRYTNVKLVIYIFDDADCVVCRRRRRRAGTRYKHSLCVVKSRRLNTFNIIMKCIHTLTVLTIRYNIKIFESHANAISSADAPISNAICCTFVELVTASLRARHTHRIHEYMTVTCICIQLRQSWINELQLFSVK